jgi:hypothetical protein
MSDRELLTECLDVLTHDAAQKTFAGGVRMSQLAIKLRAALAAPSLAVTVDPRLTPDEARAISSALAAPNEDIETLRRENERMREENRLWYSRAVALFWRGDSENITVGRLQLAAKEIDAALQEPPR